MFHCSTYERILQSYVLIYAQRFGHTLCIYVIAELLLFFGEVNLLRITHFFLEDTSQL